MESLDISITGVSLVIIMSQCHKPSMAIISFYHCRRKRQYLWTSSKIIPTMYFDEMKFSHKYLSGIQLIFQHPRFSISLSPSSTPNSMWEFALTLILVLFGNKCQNLLNRLYVDFATLAGRQIWKITFSFGVVKKLTTELINTSMLK